MGKLIKINCDGEKTAQAVMQSLMFNENAITKVVDQILKGNGYGETDTMISFDDERRVITVTPNPVDKGAVFRFDGKTINLSDYAEVDDDGVYLDIKENSLVVYQKKDNQVDKKIGVIKSIKNLVSDLKLWEESYKQSLKNEKASPSVEEAQVVE
jgi:hypothetical protein